MSNKITVELIFALQDSQPLLTVSLEAGATVADAIAQSGIFDQASDAHQQDCPVGVWGSIVDRSYRLRDGDRVEVYRQLKIDPREARRQLALAGRTMSNASD
ncbi:MAG: RnfH family protein [Proteobacteria bacterium]|nr:RnfH family protein [Pseudomonadota bacterium]